MSIERRDASSLSRDEFDGTYWQSGPGRPCIFAGAAQIEAKDGDCWSAASATLGDTPVSVLETDVKGAVHSRTMSFEAFAAGGVQDREWYLQLRSLPLPCADVPSGESCSSGCSETTTRAGDDNTDAKLRAFSESLPAPAFLDMRRVREKNLWAGRFATSGIHFDGLDNFLCVLSGAKTVYLWAPKWLRNLYPFPHSDGASTLFKSRVQSCLRAPQELEREFPLFKEAECLKGEVKAGDVLFIPNGWWHEVVTPAPTFAVNWWFTPSDKARLRPTILYLYSDRILSFVKPAAAAAAAAAAATASSADAAGSVERRDSGAAVLESRSAQADPDDRDPDCERAASRKRKPDGAAPGDGDLRSVEPKLS